MCSEYRSAFRGVLRMQAQLSQRIKDLIIQMSVADLTERLMRKDEIYGGFVASVESVIKERNGTTKDDHALAEAIVNRLIGLE